MEIKGDADQEMRRRDEFIPPSVGGIGWLRPLLFKGEEQMPLLPSRSGPTLQTVAMNCFADCNLGFRSRQLASPALQLAARNCFPDSNLCLRSHQFLHCEDLPCLEPSPIGMGRGPVGPQRSQMRGSAVHSSKSELSRIAQNGLGWGCLTEG